MKRILKWVCGGLALLLPILLLTVGRFAYLTKYKIGDIDASASPDGQYTVLFQSVGEPDWPFGASHARLVLKRGRQTVSKVRSDVANDGKLLGSENWSVIWREDAAEITVNGEEQAEDSFFALFFDGRIEKRRVEAAA